MPIEAWVIKAIRNDFVPWEDTRADRRTVKLIAQANNMCSGKEVDRESVDDFWLPHNPQIVDRSLLHKVEKYLKENKLEINDTVDENEKTVLHYAVKSRVADELVTFLLEFKNLDLNKQDSNGMTPLHYAIATYPSNMLFDLNGDLGEVVIEMLINHGAKVDLPDKDGIIIYDTIVSNDFRFGRDFFISIKNSLTKENFSSPEKYQEFLQSQTPPSANSFLTHSPATSSRYIE
jgi:ankyrin repeat protein